MKEETIAHALHADKRIAAGKQLILDAVIEHSKQITGIKSPIPELKQSYEQLVLTFSKCRGGKLWFPYLGSGIGNGPLVELMDGSVKYDFISGIGVHFWGHSHPEQIGSSLDAAISDTVMQGHLEQNGDAVEVSLLLALTADMDHCFLSTSGAMANENALKISFQKRFPANRLLAFERCFAGRTLVLSQITDKPAFRDGLPALNFIDYIPYYDPAAPQESINQAVNALKQHLKRHPKAYAAMLFEFVQGEAGYYHGSTEYFTALMEILKQEEVTIIADEVQSFGRTSQLFAFQHFGLDRFIDIITIGKLAHVCATLFKQDHCPRPGLLSQTFTSSAVAIRTAKLFLQDLLNGNYFGEDGKNMQLFHCFEKELKKLAEKYPGAIHGPFGIGTMIAFTPFDGEVERVKQLAHALFEAGLICFVAGSNPTRLRFLLPAKVLTEKDIEAACLIIDKTIGSMV